MQLEASTIACTSNYPRYRRTASNRSFTTRRNPSASTLPLFHHIRRRFRHHFCCHPAGRLLHGHMSSPLDYQYAHERHDHHRLFHADVAATTTSMYGSSRLGQSICSRQRRTSTVIAIVQCIRPLLNCSTCSNACFQLNKILYRWSQRAMPCVTAPTRDSSYRLLPAIAAITDRTWTRLSIRMYIDKL